VTPEAAGAAGIVAEAAAMVEAAAENSVLKSVRPRKQPL
jgi:hypothetical protein